MLGSRGQGEVSLESRIGGKAVISTWLHRLPTLCQQRTESNVELDPRRIDITAIAGDVTIDQLLVNTDTTVTVTGTDAAIGLPR